MVLWLFVYLGMARKKPIALKQSNEVARAKKFRIQFNKSEIEVLLRELPEKTTDPDLLKVRLKLITTLAKINAMT